MQPSVVLVGVLGAEYCTFERTVLNQFYAYYKSLVEVDIEEDEQTARAEPRVIRLANRLKLAGK